MCKAKNKGYVDSKLESKLNRIREAGNFVAHYGQRSDESGDPTKPKNIV
ncbi:MAG: hypothetical protein JTT16_04915 [Candidatus Brockarchaeota archaeon]|nr:hypothetical protein [Candidatus Brockarchaeota archaeon]